MSKFVLCAGTLFSFCVGALFFISTAFAAGGFGSPGKPPISRLVGGYITGAMLGGPIVCALIGLLPWALFYMNSKYLSGWWFAAPPALFALHMAILFALWPK